MALAAGTDADADAADDDDDDDDNQDSFTRMHSVSSPTSPMSRIQHGLGAATGGRTAALTLGRILIALARWEGGGADAVENKQVWRKS